MYYQRIYGLLLFFIFHFSFSVMCQGQTETHFSYTSYADPAPGVACAIKVGDKGIGVNGNSYFMNGNVGIGTLSPKEALSVSGRIRAKEVKVESSNWPDYVFDKDYTLMSLDSVGVLISRYGHLPGIPSKEEIHCDGQSLGEMNALLLKKVEELTLYIIGQDQRLKIQEARLNKLEQKRLVSGRNK